VAKDGGVMNGNDFFREFTLRICGSLDLDDALWRCFLYVRGILPADELILTVYDPSFGSLDVVAKADEKGGAMRADKIIMPPELRKELQDVRNYPQVRICNDVWKDPIMEQVAVHYKWPDSSAIVSRLIIQHQFIGSLIVRARERDRFVEEHGRLWSLVNEPTGIALANSRRYFELLRLKDLLTDDNRYFQNELRRNYGEEIVGINFGLREVMEQVWKVAPMLSPVLLIGETGTGKELVANAIHNLSSRSAGPLIAVNCGAIPETLIDSELFGHEKGSFTGALTQRRGRFERADKGTIFLDEVGELPLQAQTRLLRVLQEKEVERVGGSNPISVDIRIISATNRSLEELVQAGLFRADLYYRLGVFPIRIPPLRERKGDIPALVGHFIEAKTRDLGLHFIPTVAPGAIDALLRYDWPGNVREVANVVERALVKSNGRPLSFEDIAGTKGEATSGMIVDQPSTLTISNIERQHISRIMEMTRGRVEGKNGAAEILGINPATLRHRMRKLHIPFGRNREAQGER
jgi:transcriptional regulator with GAF, ATPase, and Fis domain